MIPLDDLLTVSGDRMPALLARFGSDRAALERRYPNLYSPQRRAKLAAYFAAWQEALGKLPFDDFTRADKLDWLLFRNHLTRETERAAQSDVLFLRPTNCTPK